ncbi:MAG: enoyl-CoA hydratase-related protein, partial [Dehalococcoidia bacterium]
QLERTTRELATRLAEGPPLAIRVMKRAIYNHAESTHENALEYIALAAQIINQTKDSREGITAFFERRKPDFQGQ